MIPLSPYYILPQTLAPYRYSLLDKIVYGGLLVDRQRVLLLDSAVLSGFGHSQDHQDHQLRNEL